MRDIDALLSRVHKLLALATSSNLHESAAAAAAAQALIVAHRLEHLVAARLTDADGMGIAEETLECARRPRRWRGILGAGIARSHACVVYARTLDSETELRLVGADPDRAVVRVLFEWLAPRIEWLSATHGPKRDRAWHDAFRIGAATAVLTRLTDPAVVGIHELALAEHDVRVARVDAWVAARLRLGDGRGARLHPRGYAQGSVAADELPLPGAAVPSGTGPGPIGLRRHRR